MLKFETRCLMLTFTVLSPSPHTAPWLPVSPVPNTFFDQKMSKIIDSASFPGFWSPENTTNKAVLNLWLKCSVCLYFTPIAWLCLKTKLFELYYLYTLKTEICFQKNLFTQARRLLCPADEGEAGVVRRGTRCPSVVVMCIYAKKMKGRKRHVYIQTLVCM